MLISGRFLQCQKYQHPLWSFCFLELCLFPDLHELVFCFCEILLQFLIQKNLFSSISLLHILYSVHFQFTNHWVGPHDIQDRRYSFLYLERRECHSISGSKSMPELFGFWTKICRTLIFYFCPSNIYSAFALLFKKIFSFCPSIQNDI